MKYRVTRNDSVIDPMRFNDKDGVTLLRRHT